MDDSTSVPTGPFDNPPLDLGRLVLNCPDIATATNRWLVARLADADVALGTHDYEIVAELAEDIGWDAVQVIAGWVTRARRQPADSSGDERG